MLSTQQKAVLLSLTCAAMPPAMSVREALSESPAPQIRSSDDPTSLHADSLSQRYSKASENMISKLKDSLSEALKLPGLDEVAGETHFWVGSYPVRPVDVTQRSVHVRSKHLGRPLEPAVHVYQEGKLKRDKQELYLPERNTEWGVNGFSVINDPLCRLMRLPDPVRRELGLEPEPFTLTGDAPCCADPEGEIYEIPTDNGTPLYVFETYYRQGSRGPCFLVLSSMDPEKAVSTLLTHFQGIIEAGHSALIDKAISDFAAASPDNAELRNALVLDVLRKIRDGLPVDSTNPTPLLTRPDGVEAELKQLAVGISDTNLPHFLAYLDLRIAETPIMQLEEVQKEHAQIADLLSRIQPDTSSSFRLEWKDIPFALPFDELAPFVLERRLADDVSTLKVAE